MTDDQSSQSSLQMDAIHRELYLGKDMGHLATKQVMDEVQKIINLDIQDQQNDAHTSDGESLDMKSLELIPNQKNTHVTMQNLYEEKPFFKKIGQHESLLSNDRKSGRKYNIYGLSDFHYAPTKRVKQVYQKFIQKHLLKNILINNQQMSIASNEQMYQNLMQEKFRIAPDYQFSNISGVQQENQQIANQFKNISNESQAQSFLNKYASQTMEKKANIFLVSKNQTQSYSDWNQKMHEFHENYHVFIEQDSFYDYLVNHSIQNHNRVEQQTKQSNNNKINMDDFLIDESLVKNYFQDKTPFLIQKEKLWKEVIPPNEPKKFQIVKLDKNVKKENKSTEYVSINIKQHQQNANKAQFDYNMQIYQKQLSNTLIQNKQIESMDLEYLQKTDNSLQIFMNNTNSFFKQKTPTLHELSKFEVASKIDKQSVNMDDNEENQNIVMLNKEISIRMLIKKYILNSNNGFSNKRNKKKYRWTRFIILFWLKNSCLIILVKNQLHIEIFIGLILEIILIQVSSHKNIIEFESWKVEIVGKKPDELDTFNNLNEKINSQEYFKHLSKLSCSKDDFILCEYLERTPIMMNNTGMNMKIIRYCYDYRLNNRMKKIELDPNLTELKQFKSLIMDTLGKLGGIHFLEKGERIPTQGQIIDDEIVGVTIFENDLFRAPIIKQRLQETDFVLVRSLDSTNQQKFYLRKIDYIYFVGQIEPKLEVYMPHSRSHGTFLRSCMKTFIRQQMKKNNGRIDIDFLEDVFSKSGSQNIRKALKECRAIQDTSNLKKWYWESNEDIQRQYQSEIQPKQVCLNESMLHSQSRLVKFGLELLRNADKMKKTLQFFMKKYPHDLAGWVIARRIEEELNLTSWNLSSSYLHSTTSNGRIMIHGIGDPSNGFGALNYIKMPLKARGEKEEKTNNMMKVGQVMGTDADLRKLHVAQAREILSKLGKSTEELQTLKRWDLIDLIEKYATCKFGLTDDEIREKQLQMDSLSPEQQQQLKIIIKYQRNKRLTTKMQKEQYQKEINQMLTLFLQNFQQDLPFLFEGELKLKKKTIPSDSKLKELEWSIPEISLNQIVEGEDYRLKLEGFIQKEKKIWEDKKRKKGIF